MYFIQAEHNPPHIHAIYGDDTAEITIQEGKILEGHLPPKALSMVREWITHDNAYYLNIRPEQSRSVDLNHPQPWYAPIIYFFGSLIII